MWLGLLFIASIEAQIVLRSHVGGCTYVCSLLNKPCFESDVSFQCPAVPKVSSEFNPQHCVTMNQQDEPPHFDRDVSIYFSPNPLSTKNTRLSCAAANSSGTSYNQPLCCCGDSDCGSTLLQATTPVPTTSRIILKSLNNNCKYNCNYSYGMNCNDQDVFSCPSNIPRTNSAFDPVACVTLTDPSTPAYYNMTSRTYFARMRDPNPVVSDDDAVPYTDFLSSQETCLSNYGFSPSPENTSLCCCGDSPCTTTYLSTTTTTTTTTPTTTFPLRPKLSCW